jgi:hypothetical protein
MDAGTTLFGVNSQTNAGNNLGEDLKVNQLVMVEPAGTNGTVNFSVFHALGGANPRTFSVNTSSFTDPDALANAIAAGYTATGLGLQVVVHEAIVANQFSRNPNEFTTCFVHIKNATVATEFRVQGLAGQRIVLETNDGTISIPVLSPWGVAALVGTILVTSLWFLRRRRQVSQG